MKEFVTKNAEMTFLTHQNWAVMTGDRCFKKGGQEMITHGGSHFLEVLIPFVKL